jgi:hypothetical protein
MPLIIFLEQLLDSQHYNIKSEVESLKEIRNQWTIRCSWVTVVILKMKIQYE